MKSVLESVLVLEPFGGGSHQSFYQGWRDASVHRFTCLELPAKHWRWRARHAAYTLAQKANDLLHAGEHFDAVFASSMLNLAEWKGLVKEPLSMAPAIIYFHENQLTYPTSPNLTGEERQRDYHYVYSEVLSMLAANKIWFNSEFHQQQYSEAILQWLSQMPDYRHIECVHNRLAASEIHRPGITDRLAALLSQSPAATPRTPVFGWVARWEFDKRPDLFVDAMLQLASEGHDFQLVLLGERSSQEPSELQRLKAEVGPRILWNGYAQNLAEYAKWLKQIDVVVSTAEHEFYGIGVAEAMMSGAFPLVPNRLAYPEVLRSCFYPTDLDGTTYGSQSELIERLRKILVTGIPKLSSMRTEHLLWSQLGKECDQSVESLRADFS